MTEQKRRAGDGFSVGDVAKRAGVSVQTIHFYESKELIVSSRNAGNQRRFHGNMLRRIAIIKSAQKLGLSLNEISEAFATLPKTKSPTTKQWQQMSKSWRDKLQNKIDSLIALRDQLDSCIGCGCLSIKSCSLRNPNDTASSKGVGAVFLK
ncbi:MAG: redox-sensitive transcriptional activator SoxR [Burkholderiales bacterium]|nr:redox-sensitive transcriptional activator SoxR [Burkholderiales bacterium]